MTAVASSEVIPRMPRRSPLLPLPLVVALLLGCGDSPLLPQAELGGAGAAMDTWVAEHPDGWAGAVTTTAVLRRPDWSPSCADPANVNGYVSLRLDTERGAIELAFRCPVGEHSTVADLQAAFLHAIPGNLPLGISTLHWRFHPLLPLNALFNGVTFHEPTPGQLAIDIDSEMLGIRGASLRPECAAAAATRTGCRLDRMHRVPLRMRFTVPADLSTLR